MRRARYLFLLSAFSLAVAGCNIIRAQPTDAQPSGTVSGVITGPSGPIAGAAITITPSDNSYHATQSDAQGYYSIAGLLAGSATLQVQAQSYESYSATIAIAANALMTENVGLTPR